MSAYDSVRLALAGESSWECKQAEIEKRFCLKHFTDADIFISIFTHGSFGVHDVSDSGKAFGRLGDSFISYFLTLRLVELDREDIEPARAELMLLASNVVLELCARKMGLSDYVLHRELHKSRRDASYGKRFADSFEALVGAIAFVHGPMDACQFLDERLWKFREEFLLQFETKEALTRLRAKHWATIERLCQRYKRPNPTMTVVFEGGMYKATVAVGSVTLMRMSPIEERARTRVMRNMIEVLAAPPHGSPE